MIIDIFSILQCKTLALFFLALTVLLVVVVIIKMKAFAFVKPDINWLMIKAHASVRKSQLDFVLSCDKIYEIPPLETNYDVHDYSPYILKNPN